MSANNYNEVDSQFQDIQHPLQNNKNQELEQLDGEQIIELIGGSHRYEILYSILFSLMMMIEASTFMSPPILYQTVDLKCYDSRTKEYYRCTESNGGCEQSIIQVYDNTYNTMTSQFELYCDKKHIRYYAQASVYLGAIVGVLFITSLADRYGRKVVFFGCQIIQTFLAILILLVDNIYFLMVNIAIIDGFLYSYIIVSYAFINENSRASVRSNINVMTSLFFPIGSIIFIYIFEFFKDWKTTFILAIIVPSLITCSQFLFMQESPLYLFEKQKEQELMQVMNKIAKINKRQHLIKPKYRFKFVESENTDQVQYGYSDLFKYSKLRLITITCIVMGFSNLMNYIGINYCLENIGIDIYTNTIVVQIGSLFGQLTAFFLASSMERKKSLTNAFLFSFIFNSMQVFTHVVEKGSILDRYMKQIQVLLIFMAKLAGAFCQSFLSFYLPEVFPTQVRSQGIGICSSIGMTGVAIVPFVVEFSSQIEVSPTSIISIITFIGFLFSFLAIETFEKPLLHSIQQFEKQQDNYQIEDQKQKVKKQGSESTKATNDYIQPKYQN